MNEEAIESTDNCVMSLITKYTPEEIIRAGTSSSGKLVFSVKWKGIEEILNISAKMANRMYPQTVIKFYEKNVSWTKPKDSSFIPGPRMLKKLCKKRKKNLSCKERIVEYEMFLRKDTQKKKRELRVAQMKQPYTVSNPLNVITRAESQMPMKRPKKIVQATYSDGQVMYLMQWRGTRETDIIPAEKANMLYPQVVIRYYEELLTFNKPTGVNSASV